MSPKLDALGRIGRKLWNILEYSIEGSEMIRVGPKRPMRHIGPKFRYKNSSG